MGRDIIFLSHCQFMSLDEDEFTLGRRRPQIACVIIYPGIWIIVYLVGMGQQGELEQLREVEE